MTATVPDPERRTFGPFWDDVLDDPRLQVVPHDATFSPRTVEAAVEAAVGAAVHADSAPTEPSADAGPGGAISALAALPALDTAREGCDGDLELLEVLGEGGMGVVHRARQRSLQREVAVKTLRRGVRAAVEALLSEARVAGGLDHPNVVPVHALGRDAEGRAVLVMKRVEGETWSALLRDPQHPFWSRSRRWSPDPLTRNLEVLLEVCDAVHYAHSRGVLHRDIKPENVMVGLFGEVYLMDWGLAVRAGQGPHPPGGTPAYMAPEMLEGEASERTDVYLLGAVLHEVLTGRHRHRGSSRMAVLLSVARSEPVSYGPEVAPELAAICNRATRLEPGERHPDVAAFRQAVAVHLEHRGSVQLARATEERLGELRGAVGALAPDPVAVARLGGECRFGFLQALRAWPDNAAARAGLRDCLRMQARFELARGNAAAAAPLLSELRGLGLPDDELAALEAQRAAHEEEAARRARLAADLDPTVAQGERRRLLLVGATLLGTFVVVVIAATASGRLVPTPAMFVAGPVVGLTLLVGVVVALRRVLLRNELNRRLFATLAVYLAAVVLHRFVSVNQGLSVVHTATNDLVLTALAAGLAGIAYARWLLQVAALAALGAVLAALLPAAALPALGGTVALGLVVVIATLLRGGRAA